MRIKAGLGITAAFFLALGGCEPVEFGSDPTPNDTTSTATGEASVVFMNQRQEFPGPINFLVYRPTAQDIDNVAPFKEFEPVAFGASDTVKLAAGRWKVAYRMDNGDLRAMPPSQGELEDAAWPVVVLAKGKVYLVLIETDDGNNTVWRTNLPLESPGD